MATKKFAQMATKKLNALLETASEEDRVEIQKVLDARAAAQVAPTTQAAPASASQTESNASQEEELTEAEKAAIEAAEANGGINPNYAGNGDGQKKPKISDEERHQLAEKLKAEVVNHRCQVVPFNTLEWLNGTITGVIEEKRSNKVLLSIKTDDGRRIVKVHDSKLVKVLDEVVEPVKASRGRKKDPNAVEEETDWLPEEIDAAINEVISNVGKTISYPKFSIGEAPKEGEEAKIETGRIVSLVPDKRGKRILYRIELDQTEEEKAANAPKKYAHKVTKKEDLVIAEVLDEAGEAINKSYVERRKNAAERVPLTPQEKVELAEKAYEIALKAFEKAKENLAKKEKGVQMAKEELAKSLDSEAEKVQEEEAAATAE